MRIIIADRFRPYSHLPGTYFLLPGTSLRFQIFPTFFRVHDLSIATPQLIAELQLGIQGPVQDFTVQQDLEKACLWIWGNSSSGYFRFCIKSQTDHFTLQATKCKGKIECCLALGTFYGKDPSTCQPLFENSYLQIATPQEFPIKISSRTNSRLSLGCNKSQDSEMIMRRMDPKEIFPIWLKLGQLIPRFDTYLEEGTIHLLNSCQQAILSCDKDQILPLFHQLLLTGFEGGLSPRLTDSSHQGIFLPLVTCKELSPLILLSKGAELIRQLFVQHHPDSKIHILPALPHDFHSGRLLHEECMLGLLDLEWSKKTVRRMIFNALQSGTVAFVFPKSVQNYRLRNEERDHGIVLQVGTTLEVKAGKSYLFDHFM